MNVLIVMSTAKGLCFRSIFPHSVGSIAVISAKSAMGHLVWCHFASPGVSAFPGLRRCEQIRGIFNAGSTRRVNEIQQEGGKALYQWHRYRNYISFKKVAALHDFQCSLDVFVDDCRWIALVPVGLVLELWIKSEQWYPPPPGWQM